MRKKSHSHAYMFISAETLTLSSNIKNRNKVDFLQLKSGGDTDQHLLDFSSTTVTLEKFPEQCSVF